MKVTRRVPKPLSPEITIRPVASRREREAANRLVFENYVAQGYWDQGESHQLDNQWLTTPLRDVFVAVRGESVVGTVSLIRDSADGLPSDGFRPHCMRRFRACGDRLAEGSAFAVRTNTPGLRNLYMYLLSCYLQHSYYHTRTTRLVQACRPNHADFYANTLRFERVGGTSRNSYARVPAQFLSLDLTSAHARLRSHYHAEGADQSTLYDFLLVTAHPQTRLSGEQTRLRLPEWVARRPVRPMRDRVAHGTRNPSVSGQLGSPARHLPLHGLRQS